MDQPEKSAEEQAYLFRERCLAAARRVPTGWFDYLLQRLAIAIQEERDLRDHMDTSLRLSKQQESTPSWFLKRAN